MEPARTVDRVCRNVWSNVAQEWYRGLLRILPARVASRQRETSAADNLSHQVLEALREDGCAICRLTSEAMHRRIGNLFHESVNDPGFREEVRHAGGFCQRHSSLVAHQADALGIAIVMEDVVQHRIQELRRLSSGSMARHTCPFCRAEAGDERLFVAALLHVLRSPEGADLYQRSAGLCARHMAMALKDAQPSMRMLIVQVELAVLEILADELREFVRRFDYRYASEGNGLAKDVWLRALEKTSGSSFAEEESTPK